jgi:hypothetical protein
VDGKIIGVNDSLPGAEYEVTSRATSWNQCFRGTRLSESGLAAGPHFPDLWILALTEISVALSHGRIMDR